MCRVGESCSHFHCAGSKLGLAQGEGDSGANEMLQHELSRS